MGTIIEREACTDFPLCRLRGGGASSSASTRPEPTPKWFGPEVDAPRSRRLIGKAPWGHWTMALI